jgi:hypothetical protein
MKIYEPSNSSRHRRVIAFQLSSIREFEFSAYRPFFMLARERDFAWFNSRTY